VRGVVIALSSIRLVPHFALLLLAPNRETIVADLRRWHPHEPAALNGRTLAWAFADTMSLNPEYRSLFYYRVKEFSRLLSVVLRPLCRPLSTLYIRANHIGPGLFIQHGFSTGITAERIGSNCWINQQVTIGFVSDVGEPVLGDRVQVSVGARVLGGITIGDGAVIGANAVVVKDVPANCVVVGVPARIIRREGARVDEPL
jgi:serine O-acetyltransferase